MVSDLSHRICSQVSPVAFPRGSSELIPIHGNHGAQVAHGLLPKSPVWLGWRVCVTSCTSHWAEQQKPEQTCHSFANKNNYVDWQISRNNWAETANVDAFSSLCLSNPFGSSPALLLCPFLVTNSCVNVFCASSIFPMLQTIQSWQAEMLLGPLHHPPPLVFLLPSSLFQPLLFPFSISPIRLFPQPW